MINSTEKVTALRILVVDDESANVRVLERVLRRAGFTDIKSTTSAQEALAIAAQTSPDIVLLDLHMPELSGVQVLQCLRLPDPQLSPLVVVLTGDDSWQARADALSAGAKDFITKPFDTTEVVLRIRNFAELRLLHKRLQQSNVGLEEMVRARTSELEEARLDVLDRLAKAAEFRDDATGQHTRRVGTLAGRLARALSRDDREVELIARAAPLHDVGKIAIPDRVLLKPGPLDAEEMAVMRTHTTVGAQLLASSRSPLLEIARVIALAHHERWDGSGYPQRLGEHDIPLTGRIVGLADFVDALSHDRPYRRSISFPEVLQMVRDERGRHFDPDVVDAFLEIAT